MKFVVTSEKPAPDPRSRSFEKSGRMFLAKENLRVVIDGSGMYDISLNGVHVVMLGLGDSPVYVSETMNQCGSATLSVSRRGFYLTIGTITYVTPADRVRKVLSGEHRKAPVFLVREPRSELSGGDAIN